MADLHKILDCIKQKSRSTHQIPNPRWPVNTNKHFKLNYTASYSLRRFPHSSTICLHQTSCLFFVSRIYNMSDIIYPKLLFRSTQLSITMCQNPKACVRSLAVRLNHFKSLKSVCYERKVTRGFLKIACVSRRCWMWWFIMKFSAVCQKVGDSVNWCCLLSVADILTENLTVLQRFVCSYYTFF